MEGSDRKRSISISFLYNITLSNYDLNGFINKKVETKVVKNDILFACVKIAPNFNSTIQN